jgi:hypothetical protein
MAKHHTAWRVLPHGPIEKLSERLWRVEGSLDNMPLKRVMSVARRKDGGLVVHNAIAVDDAALAELAAWGPVRTIIVPNAFHRLDAVPFHERFPEAQVVCPAGTRDKVEQVVKVDATYEALAPDEHVEVQTVDGVKAREGVVIVRDGGGTSLVFNDLIFNMPHAPGFKGFVVRRIMGSSGGPKVTRLGRMFLVADKRAVRAHLERLAALPDLRRIIVSHHVTIDQDAPRVLGEIAAAI